ncbi:MAG: hypothetical protein RIR70_605 [Pseudomonadota bacterium]
MMPNMSAVRSFLVFAFDALAVSLTWYGAYLLRFNFDIPTDYARNLIESLPVALLVQLVLFRVFGLYRGIWQFASLPDLMRIIKAVGASIPAMMAALFFLRTDLSVPRSVVLIQPMILLLLMGGGRFAWRAWREHRVYGALRAQGKPVLVLGAGEAAASLLRELSHSAEWRVVGLLDDDPGKHALTLHGVKVMGPIDALDHWARKLSAQHAIIAMPSSAHEERKRAASLCVRAGIKALTVPSFDDLISGRITVASVRNVEVEDLLGRDPVWIDTPALNGFLRDRCVMVTGAGGSIGSELCRQIARFAPAQIIAFEQNEFALYRLQEEFNEHFPEITLVCLAGDVKDTLRVESVLRTHAPAVVFHAAAYKHVPLMEEHNAWEAVRNNVWGTLVVARAAAACGVGKLVLVSTDKAVNPTNVMGATKRLAEKVCLAVGASGGTQIEMVRFGNVLGSAGSVIPKFQEQIARGGPVTVTHPDITRYFMSIPEAAQLVLQAGVMGEGGTIFVLEMGEPVRIADLARDMIRLSGASEHDIKILYTGLRPGEKLYEELLADREHTLATPHPKLRVARSRPVEEGWLEDLVSWLRQNRIPPDIEVRRDLRRWVPEYEPATHAELRVIDGGH